MNTFFNYQQSQVKVRHKKGDLPLKHLLVARQTYLRTSTRKGDKSFQVHLTNFAGGELLVKDITPKFCHEFAAYLITKVRINSARTYLQKLHALLQEAVNQNYISYNPMPPMNNLLPRYKAPERAYLTVKEINQLKCTKCNHESTKLAFLFACYTGLRISDIETLKWEHIHTQNNVAMLIKTQIKTNHEVRIPLGREAKKILTILKQHKKTNDYIFHLLSRTSICSDLKAWAKAAGIDKHVTFHVARHSFATLSISAGVSLFTISKLCGHTDIKTTQIYAKLMDSTRIEAIACLDELFNDSKRKKSRINKPYDLIL